MRALLLLLLPSILVAQQPAPAGSKLPPAEGFRVYFITDMEGMASVVFNREIISGWEGERYRDQSSRDYWEHYRALFTDEVNAAVEGARAGGARSFVVNEGHGGNLFANLLPWQLDTAAVLVRGFPKPMLMSAALDSSVDAVVFIGAHASPGTGGVIAHNYAFDTFDVNGTPLNETGINALIASEFGAPVILVSGDDIVTAEAKRQLGAGAVTVTTKYALSGSAAVTYSPAVVRQMLRDSVASAVRRAMRGEYQPLRLSKPYRIEFAIRRSYPRELIAPIDTLSGFNLAKTGDRSYVLVTDDAREMARLLDVIERIVLR